jgi:hypothetical protein
MPSPRSFIRTACKTSRPCSSPSCRLPTIRVLGMVPEGSDQVHVVVRATRTIEKAEINRVDVVTLKRGGREWKMLLPSELRVVAETIKRLGPPGHDSATAKDADSGSIHDTDDGPGAETGARGACLNAGDSGAHATW